MQGDIKNKKKMGAIVCAAIVVAFLAAYLIAVFFLMTTAVGDIPPMVGYLLVYGGAILAAIVGVLIALRLRLKEIKGGEEEDAKQY